MSHATYIRNRAYTKALPDSTPYEKWTGTRPDISHIQTFGHPIWILNQEINPSKLDPQAKKQIFIGYQDGPKAIKYYDTKKRTVKVSREYHWPLTTTEHRFEGERQGGIKPLSDERKRKRQKLDTEKQDDNDIPDLMPCDDNDDDDDECQSASTAAAAVYMAFTEANISEKEPKTLSEVKRSPEWPEWQKAIQTELEMLEWMGTWELVDAPEDRKPVTNKWVFVKKYDKNGNLQK